MASANVNRKVQDKEMQEAFEQDGMEGFIKKVKETLDKWKKIPLNIAITGRSGVGKSSLINALMGLDPEDEGAAAVGVVETTATVKAYPHHANRNLVFYDLPGVGTPNFPKSTYLTDKAIGFESYDVFIIVTANRFSEEDAWLGSEIANQKKSYVFVRSQIGIDLMKEKQTKKRLFATDDKAAEKSINVIRQDCQKNLKVANAKVYLVDSYETHNTLFDFDDLNRFLLDSFPDWKRDAIVLAMSYSASVFIDEKKKVLANRIHNVALLSAVGGAIPIPGLSLTTDVRLILAEMQFYQNQYGLNEARQNIEMLTGLQADELQTSLKLSAFSAKMSKDVLVSELPSLLRFTDIERIKFQVVLPIFGSIVGGFNSYQSTSRALEQILDNVTEDAHVINRHIQEHTKVRI